MTLTFEPLLPPIAWVSLALPAIVLWVWYALKRPAACGRWLWWVIMGLTLGGLVSVLAVLLNPIWLEPLPPPAGKPLLTILVDRSASMSTADGPDQQSRYVAATQAVSSLTEQLSSRFEIRLQTFAEQPNDVDKDKLVSGLPDGSSTDLAAPLTESLAADRPQGQAVLLISDGIHTATSDTDRAIEAAQTAKSRDAPVYTTTVGGDVPVKDLSIRVPRSQELAFVGQSVPVTIELQQHGSIGDRVDVTLTAPGGEKTTQTTKIVPNSTGQASFMVSPPETGLFQYQVKAAALPGEATTGNNATTFQVRVVDKPVKALVLEGKPYWDAKFLLRMLTDDPSLEVDCIVRVTAERFLWRKLKLVDSVGAADVSEDATRDEKQLSADENASGNAADDQETSQSGLRFQRQEELEFVKDVSSILQDPDQLKDYQILLLGREAESYLGDDAIDNIRTWIATEGGSLICYRGSPVAEPDQKLSRLLPVRWATGRAAASNDARFRIQVTERGDDMSWLRIGGADGLSKLPSLSPSATTESTKPLAVVLGRGGANIGASPALTYQPYGTGKVVVVEGSGMWRWAFLAPEYRKMESAYGTLWQSLLRWLISSGGLLPGEDVALQMDRVSFTEGESVSAVVLRRPELDTAEIPSVKLLDDDGNLVRTIQPIPVGEELGVYRVFVGSLIAGHYQTQLETLEEGKAVTKSVHFDVRPDLREQLEVSARPDLMQRIAEVSGGEVLALDKLSDLASKFESHIEQSRPVQYRRRPAWDRWWVLIGVLLLWSISWGLRRRTGLV